MSKHTPGPWKIGDDVPVPANVVAVVDETYAWVARVAGDDVDEAVANAHLVAAAPDMLEALRAYQAANRIHNDSESDLYEKGAAAIAKAQGKATP